MYKNSFVLQICVSYPVYGNANLVCNTSVFAELFTAYEQLGTFVIDKVKSHTVKVFLMILLVTDIPNKLYNPCVKDDLRSPPDTFLLTSAVAARTLHLEKQFIS